MAKIIKDIRNWGFPSGQGGENKGFEPFIPVFKRMLKAVGVGYKDPCCADEKNTCQDPCGFIQTLSTDDMSTISITGLDGAPGNTIDLKKLVDYSETVTSLVTPYFKPDADGRPNILVTGFMNEDHVLQEVEVDLGDLLPDLMIQEGAYDELTNVVTLTTYDGTKITFTINELTGISNTLTKPNKQIIGTFHDENEQNTDFYETVTSATLSGNILTIVNEDGSQPAIDFSGITPNCCVASASYADNTGVLTLTKVDGSTVTTVVSPKYTYALDTATDEIVITSPDGSVTKLDLSALTPDCCISTISDVDPATGNVTFTRADGSTVTAKVDTLTTLSFAGTNLSYTDEKGTVNLVDLSGLLAAAITNSLTNDGTNTLTSNVSGVASSAAIVNNVTSGTSGSSLNISVNGVAASTLDLTSAVQAAETNTTITNTFIGKKIADYTNEDGTVFQINETVTSATSDNQAASTKVIGSVTNENGVTTTIKETVTSFDAVQDDAAGTITLTFNDENGAPTVKTLDVCALLSACRPTAYVFALGYHSSDASIACADAP